MSIKSLITLTALLPLNTILLSGCGTSPTHSADASPAPSKAERKTDDSANASTLKKISRSIGEEVGDFRITKQESTEAPTGYNGMEYTVKTNSGKTYKCEILENSTVGKIFTWGMGSGSDAMCTDFTKGSKDRGKTNKANCNDLLRAAGKC